MTRTLRSGRTVINALDSELVEDVSFAGLEETNLYEHEGTECELQTFESRYNSRGDRVLLRSGSRSAYEEDLETVEAALVLTRYFSTERELEKTLLRVHSPYIKAALKTAVESYPGVNLDSNGPIDILDEPRCLFHYRKEIHSYKSKIRDKKAKQHVTLCLQYMNKVLREEITCYDNMFRNKDVSPGIEFKYLWMAFRPGSLLCEKVDNVDVAYRLREMTKRQLDDGSEHWRLCIDVLAYDGESLGYIHNDVKIQHYDGIKPLVELQVFPLNYHRERDSVKANILARGKRYVSLSGIHHCMYEGVAQVHPVWSEASQRNSTASRSPG